MAYSAAIAALLQSSRPFTTSYLPAHHYPKICNYALFSAQRAWHAQSLRPTQRILRDRYRYQRFPFIISFRSHSVYSLRWQPRRLLLRRSTHQAPPAIYHIMDVGSRSGIEHEELQSCAALFGPPPKHVSALPLSLSHQLAPYQLDHVWLVCRPVGSLCIQACRMVLS